MEYCGMSHASPVRAILSCFFATCLGIFGCIANAQTPVPSGAFPRIGSIWTGEYSYMQDPTDTAKMQAFFAPNFTSQAASSIIASNPNAPLLLGFNIIETLAGVPDVPSSYFLYTTTGDQICNWPGTPPNYILNMTNSAVPTYMANYAQQLLSSTTPAYNGIFFDNLISNIGTKTTDCYGNSIAISSQDNGTADSAAALNLAWQAGVINEISAFRTAAPTAYSVVHGGQSPPNPLVMSLSNGDVYTFDLPLVRESSEAFGTLWNSYHQWYSSGAAPVITSLQSSPPTQISYGYGYAPATNALAQTIAFGKTFYPSMRFGLAFTLMNNGFFMHNLGDVSSSVAWWYDDFDFSLGSAATPAQLIGSAAGSNMLTNGDFSSGLSNWSFSASSGAASVATDSSTVKNSPASAHVNVTALASAQYNILLEQNGLSVTKGKEYEVSFWANSDAAFPIMMALQGGSPNYSIYGLLQTVWVEPGWHKYTVAFLANATASDGRLEFRLGNGLGNIWFDDVQMYSAETRLYRRDFQNGVVLLNGTNSSQTVTLEAGLKHFTGTQAPKYQYIVDDSSSSFSSTGTWATNTVNSGYRQASGPYYHAWGYTLHELDSTTGSAQWNLGIPADGQYTIQVWLPAATTASSWTKNAVYQISQGGSTIATVSLDQSAATAGDQWYTLGSYTLSASSSPTLVLSNGGTGSLIADAVHVYSTTDRYNDGSSASTVTIPPMDGVLLQRNTPSQTITFPNPGSQTVGASVSLTASATSGQSITYLSNTPSVCAVSGSTASMLTTGTCSISAAQAGNSSYTAAVPVTDTFSVYLSQSISLGSIATQVLGSAAVTETATATSGLAVSLASATTSTCSVSSSAVSLLAAGTCTLTANQAGNSTYAAAPTVQTSFLIVNPQTITFASIATQGLGGLPLSLTATASSGLQVSYASSDATVCTVSGSLLTLVSVGKCSVTASQAGSSSYAAATPVTQSFTVVPNLVINSGFESKFTPWVQNKLSGVAASALNSSSFVQGSSSGSITVTTPASAMYQIDLEQGSLPVANSATYTLKFWAKSSTAQPVYLRLQGGSPNYANYGLMSSAWITTSWAQYSVPFTANSTATDARLEFLVGLDTGSILFDNVQLYGTSNVAQTITFPAIAAVNYGAAPVQLAATANSGLAVSYASNSTSVCTISGSTAVIVGTGTCSITASQTGNSVYLAASPVTNTFTVGTESQSITFPAIAAQTYGVSPITMAATATSGLAVSYASNSTSVCTVSGSTLSIVGAGTCSVTASQTGNSLWTAATSVTQSFTVSPLAQSITFAAIATQGTGGLPFTVSATATSGLAVSFTASPSSVCTISSATITPVASGICTVTASQPGNAGYAAASSVAQSFVVVPNLLTNGGFEKTLSPWVYYINAGAASAAYTTSALIDGTSSALLSISTPASAMYLIDFEQPALSVTANATYMLKFWAKSSLAQQVYLRLQGGSPSFANYGLSASSTLTTSWVQYAYTFTANTTASDARLEFLMGIDSGSIWLDDVQLYGTANVGQSIAFPALASSTTAATTTLAATATSGLAVSYLSNTPTICSVSGSTAVPLAVGTCSITASQSGNSVFLAATPVTQTMTITQ